MSTYEKNMKGGPKISGIRIKNVNYAFLIILTFAAVVLFIIARNIYDEYLEINELADNYDHIQYCANDVRSASDELTRDVQLFVMRGDISYLDSYFREANDTRRREIALEELKELDVSDELVGLLEQSVQQSMELMQLEYRAMRYAAGGYHISDSELPEEVLSVKLPEDLSSISDSEKIKKAQELVFGDEYYGYKARIGAYQQQYLDRALTGVLTLKKAEKDEMQRLLASLQIALFIVFVTSIALFMMISRMIVNPLRYAVRSIATKNTIAPLQGTYEIKYMSQVYNDFHYDSVEIQKKLKHEAERDALTGVLNRRGHQTVIEALSAETYPIALLIVDIDDFKHVNDTYGHETGDIALKKLARALLDTFRSTDITSRVGGDEFVVIMGDITKENKDAIERKAGEINRLMSIPGPDECPPLSVSIGCAFSHVGYNDHIFNEADEKMYEVKRSGGNGIRF